MGFLKELDCHLAEILEGNQHACCSALFEEFLCCCERARHAIKEFTNQGPDGNVCDCFPVAGDALRDLHWFLDRICPFHGSFYGAQDGTEKRRYFEIGRALHTLVNQIKQVPSVSSYRNWHAGMHMKWPWQKWDAARNGRGRAHNQLPPGLNVDDIGEIRYSSALGEGSEGMVYKAMWGRDLPPEQIDVDDLLGGTGYSTSELGSNGTYKARHEWVAVKEVSSHTQSEGLEALGSLVSRGNLYCELDVLKTLNHPNIVELKGYTRKVRAAGKYGLVMELMKCSLGDLIINSEQLSDLAMVDVLLQVARGMHFLHTVGIMHRDLKPANILIRELNYLPPNDRRLGYVVAKLADFGLSKGLSEEEVLRVDRAGLHTYKQGTTFYMAPEVRKSCGNDWESRYAMSADVFSFGTTCFNVLTGHAYPCTGEHHPPNSEEFECPSSKCREEFYRRIGKGDLNELFNIKYRLSKVALLVRQCWCLAPHKRPSFLQICHILEDEKRRILCPSTSTSQILSPRNGLGKVDDFGQTEHLHEIDADEIEYFYKLGEGERAAMWRGVHHVEVKRVSTCYIHLGLRMLNHPNVVGLKGYCTWDTERVYSGVVMETMISSLGDLRILSELESVNVLLQVARGMEFLHAEGIIHLALKPANILLGRRAEVAKIADPRFGPPQVLSQDFYVAPELLKADLSTSPPKLSADVFSFGTTCFNLFNRAYTRAYRNIPLEPTEFYQRIERRELGELLEECGAYSTELRGLVRECWCPDPNSRPSFVEICGILEKEKKRIEEALKGIEEEKKRIEQPPSHPKMDTILTNLRSFSCIKTPKCIFVIL